MKTMLFQTKYNFPVKKSISKPEKSENVNPCAKQSVKRALFDSSQPLTSPKKLKVTDENQSNQLETSHLRVAKPSNSSLVLAKQAFHTGLPSKLVGRSQEISQIDSFLNEHMANHSTGSMYISGAPGTGKTASLMSVLKNMEKKFSLAFINCMSLSNSTSIYKIIAREFKLPAKVSNSKNIAKSLENYILTSKDVNVLILDEIDHLDSKGQEVLYSLFEWPQLPNSSLILIGIANALDLTDRLLPRLHAFKYQPKLMHFQPYTKDQIISILESRLSEFQSGGTTIIKPAAIQLCARKIAASTGDIRKALDVCRRAIEIVENKDKLSTLKPTSDDRCNPGSPMKRAVLCVELQDIVAVLHEVYGSRLQASHSSDSSKTVTMPLQHMILLCTLVLMKKHCKTQDINLGKLHDIYKRVCKKRDITAVSECSFHGLCSLVESRGFIELKTAKVPRMTKVFLKIDEAEAEYVLQDKAMLRVILADSSVLNK